MMSRVKQSYTIDRGEPFPLGASRREGGVNFALFCRHGSEVILVVNPEGLEIRLDPELNRTGDIWHIFLACGKAPVVYGYRVDGSPDFLKGIFFYPDRVLLDPYARKMLPRAWNSVSDYGKKPSCLIQLDTPFDWGGDRPLKNPVSDMVIYELHVRGFTRHPNSSVSAPGTFKGVIEKIPYLKQLGVTAVELLPVTEWDETDNKFYHPETKDLLLNYWGYNPLSFFCLKSGFASAPAAAADEFKLMVRSLHQAGMEVILDMVFNHSGETDLEGTTTCFRGIDNSVYYLVDEKDGRYYNFSGCGNTFNCNHPVVRKLIIDSLHYWVTEMHVDGFRFDLAAIFSRDTDGEVMNRPPLVDLIAQDPLLRDTKIIAEAWDAAGLYQVGTFSGCRRWQEWNGRFRDDVRMFMHGEMGSVKELATRLAGSSDLYQKGSQGPLNSINFITSHDGFTLYDLVSYNEKANHANGEDNRDGENHNLSWNSGHEGDPCSPQVKALRFRRMRTFAALLLLSQGVPMITAGDEFGRTQGGNNNSWCQDNETGWVDWRLAKTNKGLLRFFSKCIALRKKHQVFRRSEFFEAEGSRKSGLEISWQSLIPGNQDWSDECRTLGFHLHLSLWQKGSEFIIMVNGDRMHPAQFTIPESAPERGSWCLIINTAEQSPLDIVDYKDAEQIASGRILTVPPMGLIVLEARRR